MSVSVFHWISLFTDSRRGMLLVIANVVNKCYDGINENMFPPIQIHPRAYFQDNAHVYDTNINPPSWEKLLRTSQVPPQKLRFFFLSFFLSHYWFGKSPPCFYLFPLRLCESKVSLFSNLYKHIKPPAALTVLLLIMLLTFLWRTFVKQGVLCVIMSGY